MNKEQILNGRINSIFFGILLSSLDASELTLESSYDFLKKITNDNRKQQFAVDFLCKKNIANRKKIHKKHKLGEGGFGTIYAGSSDNQIDSQDLIIKEETSENVGNEIARSESFTNAIAQRLNQQHPWYGRLLGMGSVVTVIGKTTDGSLIQERIQGKNLFTTTYEKFYPYQSGFPDNLQEAVSRAVTFYAGLVALHEAGFVHCDIKSENIMVSNDISEGNPCRIIDLAGLTKIGEDITIYSFNGAPEFIRPICLLVKYSKKYKKLNKQKQSLIFKMKNISNFQKIIKLKNKIAKIQTRIHEIKNLQEAILMDLPAAETSYDIYSSASILPPIFFGKIGYELINDLYFPDEELNPIQYVQDAQDANFDANQYFTDHFLNLNQRMKEEIGISYPRIIIDLLAKLQAEISSLNPDERPSAIDILEDLQDISLADWENEHYSIQ